MDQEPQTTVVAQGGFDQLREFQAAFRLEGLDSEIVRPPAEHCSS